MGQIEKLKDSVILVSGATGTFGKEFIRTLLKNSESPKIKALSRDELKLGLLSEEFNSKNLSCFVADLRDFSRISELMSGVDYVVHAAALKQVLTSEKNPFEFIKTNILGTKNILKASAENNVDKFLMLSTDKAVMPVNVYGATKFLAEKMVIDANNSSIKSKFSVVRYGNVMNSRGSVVEVFQRILKTGKKALPITDQKMTRFWMLIREAVNFVVNSLFLMKGGEIFIPKLPSIRIMDLALALSGSSSHENIGIRKGEKIHEYLWSEEELSHIVEFENYYSIMNNNYSYEKECTKVFNSGENKKFLSPDDISNIIKDEKIA